MARAHAGVAGLLAAADLQLRHSSRPSSAGRTSTASPARSTASSSRPARPPAPPARSRPARRVRSEPQMKKVLVVANETVGGEKLLDAVREKAGAGDVASCSSSRIPPAQVGQRHLRRGRARRRPRCGSTSPRQFLAGEGIELERRGRRPRPVHGGDGRDRRSTARRGHHLDAPGHRVRLAAPRPGRAHRRRPQACRSSTSSPTSSSEGLPFDVTLVVANQTLGEQGLLDRLKAKARRAQEHLFIVVVPQEQRRRPRRPRGARAPDADARDPAARPACCAPA